MAEWLKATDCKSVHVSVRRFEPYSAHIFNLKMIQFGDFKINSSFNRFGIVLIFKSTHFQIFRSTSGSSSFGRAIAFQAIGGRFEPGLPLLVLYVTVLKVFCSASRGSSGVEHPDDIGRVSDSILTDGSTQAVVAQG